MRVRRGNRAGLLCGTVSLIVFAMRLPSPAANLLVNPAFESPTDTSGNTTDSTCTGWTFYGSCVRSDAVNHTPGGTWAIQEQTFAPGGIGGIYQNVGGIITPGYPYTLSVYQYFQPNAPAVPGLVTDLALTFLNASNQPVGPTDPNGYSDATYIPAGSAQTGVWTNYTVSGVAPAGTTQVQVSFDFVNGSSVAGGNQSTFIDDADLEAIEPFEAPSWANAGSGDWNVAANWDRGFVPNGVSAEADFFGAITSPSTIYTNVPVTVGFLHFNSSKEYLIAGAGSLTLQATRTAALVEVDQGTDNLALPITIASNTVLDIASGANLIISNQLTIDAGMSVTQSGGGTVTYQSTITVDPGASISFANSSHANALSVPSAARASISGTGSVLTLNSLSNSGALDVQKNRLLINYGNTADPISSIESQLRSGYAGGKWNGPGIDSSAAAQSDGRLGVGWADGADGVVSGLASGQIEVQYALYGDINLDGVVNGLDLAIFAANYGEQANQWDQGDFNYDGAIDETNFKLLVENFGMQTNGVPVPLPPGDWAALDAFAAANGLMADVPEPDCGILAILAATGALGRRSSRMSLLMDQFRRRKDYDAYIEGGPNQ